MIDESQIKEPWGKVEWDDGIAYLDSEGRWYSADGKPNTTLQQGFPPDEYDGPSRGWWGKISGPIEAAAAALGGTATLRLPPVPEFPSDTIF